MVQISGAQQTNLRKDGFAIRVYATPLHNPTPACTTTINAVVDYTNPVKTVSLNTSPSQGALANIIPHTLAEIYDSSARYKGAVRVATGGYSGGTLQIAEIGKNHVYIVNGDTIKIYHSPQITEKLVGNTQEFLPDGRVTYTNQTTALSPRANTGGHWVGNVDSGQTYATVVFAGSNSYTVDPDSAGTITYAWTFGSNASPTTSTSANPSVQFNVGYHLVSLTVTDSTNSKTRTQYTVVRVHDSTNLPTEVILNSLERDVESGGYASITLYNGDYTLTTLPDESLICLWAEQAMLDGTALDMGHEITGRSHILFIGKLQRETASYTNDANTVTFELIAPLGGLQAINAYAKLLTEYTPAGFWDLFEDLSTKIAIEFLLDWYTTYADWFDVSTASLTSFDWTGFSIDAGTPYNQIRDLIDHRAIVTQDRTGRLLIYDNPILIDVGATRNGYDTVITLTEDDLIVEVGYSHEHPPRLQRLRGEGFNTSAVDVYADYPSLTPGRGSSNQTIPKMLTTDQTEINRLTGHWGAFYDNVYINANGQKLQVDEVELTLPAQYYQVFENYRQWVALNISTSEMTLRRGLNLNNWRYIVQSVSLAVNHEDSTGITQVRLKPETAGYTATTYTPPTQTTLPSYTLPQLITPPFGIVFPTTTEEALMNNIAISNAVAGGLAGNTDDGTDPDKAHPSLPSVFGGSQAIQDGLCWGITLYVESLCYLKKAYTQQKNSLTIDSVFPTYLHGGTGYEASLVNTYLAADIITAMDDSTAKEAIECAYRVAVVELAIDDVLAAWESALTTFTPADTNQTILKTFFTDMTLAVNGKTNPNFSFFLYCIGYGISEAEAGNPVVGCPCYDWCLYADFAVSDKGFTATASSGTPTYVFADGAWRQGSTFTQAGDSKKGVKIEISFTSCDLVGVVCVFDCTFSNLTQNINNQINLFTGGSGGVNTVSYAEDEQAGTSLNMSWSGEALAIDFMALAILCGGRAGGGALTGGTVYLRSVTMFGTGVAPTIAGWTPCT